MTKCGIHDKLTIIDGLIFWSDGTTETLHRGNVAAANVTVCGFQADFLAACEGVAGWRKLLSDPDSGWHIFRWLVSTEPPVEDLSLILSDIVGNLRSTLDYLVWQLVLLGGRKPGRQASFPVVKRAKDWPVVEPDSGIFGETPFQLVGQGARRGVAVLGGVGHRLLTDRIERRVDRGEDHERRGEVALARGLDHLGGPSALDRGTAGQDVVEGGAQAVDVGADIDVGLPARLFRADVEGRPGGETRLGLCRVRVGRWRRTRRRPGGRRRRPPGRRRNPPTFPVRHASLGSFLLQSKGVNPGPTAAAAAGRCWPAAAAPRSPGRSGPFGPG